MLLASCAKESLLDRQIRQAQDGNEIAQWALWDGLSSGLWNFPVDKQQALYWLSRSAAQNYCVAMVEWGIMNYSPERKADYGAQMMDAIRNGHSEDADSLRHCREKAANNYASVFNYSDEAYQQLAAAGIDLDALPAYRAAHPQPYIPPDQESREASAQCGPQATACLEGCEQTFRNELRNYLNYQTTNHYRECKRDCLSSQRACYQDAKTY